MWKDEGNGIYHLRFGSLRARLENSHRQFEGHWVLTCPGLMTATSMGLLNENVANVQTKAVTHLMGLLVAASEDLGRAV